MRILRALARHPVWSSLGTIILWCATFWPIFSDKTLPQFIATKHFGAPLSVVAWLTVATGSLLILFMLVILWAVSSSAMVYQNRNEMNKERGGISRELETVKRAWIIWQAGGATIAIADSKLSGIERLILRDPTIDQSGYAKKFRADNTENVVNAIKTLTSRAKKQGVKVRWHRDPNASLVINDQSSGSAWARIELLLPGVESEYRPNIIIKKAIHPDMFRSLVEMFQHEWDDACEAD